MSERFPDVKTAKELIESDIPLEHPEKAYRRGYRDAILVLGLKYNSLSRSKFTRIYNWALDGALHEWQREIRDMDDPDIGIAPDFP